MTLSSVPAAKCRGLPAGRGQKCGFCGSLRRGLQVVPHIANLGPAAACRARLTAARDGRVDRDGVFDTAPAPEIIVTTVTIVTP